MGFLRRVKCGLPLACQKLKSATPTYDGLMRNPNLFRKYTMCVGVSGLLLSLSLFISLSLCRSLFVCLFIHVCISVDLICSLSATTTRIVLRLTALRASLYMGGSLPRSGEIG